jgi:hypothetical protein
MAFVAQLVFRSAAESIGHALPCGVVAELIHREPAFSPAVAQRFEGHVEADLVAEPEAVHDGSRGVEDGHLDTGDPLALKPSVRVSSDMCTTRIAGCPMRGAVTRLGMASQTSKGACVPISWNCTAESRQTTPLGTRRATSASERCSLVAAPGRAYRPRATRSSLPTCTRRVSEMVGSPLFGHVTRAHELAFAH